MKKLLIILAITLGVVVNAQEPFTVTIEGYTVEQGDSLKNVIANLELVNELTETSNASLEAKIDSLEAIASQNCDSIGFYKQMAVKWENSYMDISPYHKEGYALKASITDTNEIYYEFTQRDGKSWTRIIDEKNKKSINFWQFGDQVEFWYGYNDSTWVYDDPRYPDKDSVYVNVNKSHMITRYNINWFDDCE